MRSRDPAIGLARGFLRHLSDDKAVEEFDELVDEYGFSEAAAEMGAGFLLGGGLNQHRRRNRGQGRAPLINEQPDTVDEDGRTARVLTIDVPQDELRVLPNGEILTLRTPAGYFEHDIGWPIDGFEFLPAGESATKLVVYQAAEDLDVEIDVDEDADESGSGEAEA